jgi:uncharacterized protein (DUF1330 family)
LIAAAAAELVSRGNPQTVVGSADNQPDLVAIMRFPIADAVRAFLGSAAYSAQIVHRSAGVRGRALVYRERPRRNAT